MMGLEALPEERKRFLLLGDVTALFLNSDYHKNFRIVNMWKEVVVPLTNGQYRIYYNKQNLPTVFVSWAFMSDEVSEKYQTGNYSLNHDEWKSGNNLWLMDFIAPFGDAKKIFADLYENVFGKEHKAKFIRRNHDGSVRRIVKLFR
ncbi:MAG: toxin-activating lysine-acyltransferase [Rickettsiales bacterium]|nr:toxin-activating lysine-acyltransferase [Rickettsiales bacterium]